MAKCNFIQSMVKNKVRCFFPDGRYQSIAGDLIGDTSLTSYRLNRRFLRSVQDEFKLANCYVVYFPSEWCEDINGLLLKVKSSLSSQGVLLVVEHLDDLSGQKMCHMADQWKKTVNMHTVCDQIPYQGKLAWVKPSLVFFQFWKITHMVSSWEEY